VGGLDRWNHGMEKLTTIVMWTIHWALQGLKLWFFAVVALIAALVACLPFALIDSGLNKFLEPSQFTNIASVVFTGLSLIVELAVGTAVLASMLDDHPLRPFSRRQGARPEDPTSRTSRSTTTA